MERKMATLRTGPVEYTDSGGSGPIVVLLHGALMDEGHWARVVDSLRAEVRCVVPVLPIGAHRQPMPTSADLSPTGLAMLVADLLEALDLRDVIVVGNDTGGAIAQLLVTSRPERTAGLVLVSCDAFDNLPPGLPGRTMALACAVPGGMFAAMVTLRVPALRRLPMTFGWMTKRPINPELFGRWLSAYFADRRIRTDLARVMRGLDRAALLAAAEGLRQFDKPALMAWAAEDRVMPVEHATRLAERLPQGQVAWIEDSYTLVPLDQPERLAALIGSFIAQHGRPDSGTTTATPEPSTDQER